ncbi:MAG: tetratricopeptide repeat protein [Candidatus Zixiibacteriota bacterium]
MLLKKKVSAVVLGVLLVSLSLTGGCVYYNTFYNARKAFNQAEKDRKKDARGRINSSQYKTAIEKSLKVAENYPNSKYYDDALFVLGVSYYHTQQYLKADRRLRELVIDYPESKYYKEGTLYHAKTKLALREMDEAIHIFRQIFETDFDKIYKTEAAMALGVYNFEQAQYDEAYKYFLSIRDSLGNRQEQRLAQSYIADGYFNTFNFSDALGSYLQLLGMEPDVSEKYHALYQAAICSYRLQRIRDGLDYLKQLSDDQLFYDSLGVLKLTEAEGYEYDGDLELAEATYADVTRNETKKTIVGKAYYQLGLIYQYEYDDLKQAKEYYDKAVENTRGSDIGNEALQRSSAIGKLETFSESIKIDTNATQEMIDEVAYTQYLLAELYWFELNKPDSAMLELQYLIDSFPTTYDAPKAMIALSQMRREYNLDTLGADTLLKAALRKYPHSDYVPEVLDLLGLRGTAADTGYAEYYFRRAENFLVDDSLVDSALANFQYIVDNFPDSRYYLHARFNTILTRELYQSTGDSSIVLAYQAFSDSFPQSEFASEAKNRLKFVPRQRIPGTEEAAGDSLFAEVGDTADTSGETETEESNGSSGYVDFQQSMYIRPNGDTVALLAEEPIETIEEFIFPSSAYGMEQDFYLYFQVLLDFSGKVLEYELKNPSSYEDINDQASRTVGSMTFDPLAVSKLVSDYNLPEDPDGQGHWFVYKYLVEKPDFLR